MLEILEKGGPLMTVILVTSAMGLILFLERFVYLHRARIKTDDFLKGIYNVLKKGNPVEAVSLCEEVPGPVAHIVRSAILHQAESPSEIERQVIDAGKEEIPNLERNLGLLITFAKLAPLLGLLGTILGLIDVLMIIEQKAPLIHVGDVTGGLWQALLTTAAGLAVAIPLYGGHNFLINRVEILVVDMERAASDVIGFLSRHQNSQSVESVDA